MNSSKIFSKKVQTILLSVGMVLYSLMPGVLAAQSNWVPPTGPPPNNNAPRPFHQGETGQAKYYGGQLLAPFSIGAFSLYAEALIGTFGVFDGPGVVASNYCFGDVGNFSSFPGNINSLTCISEDDWLVVQDFLSTSGQDSEDGQNMSCAVFADGVSLVVDCPNSSIAVNILQDGANANDCLVWDGSAWVSQPCPTGGGALPPGVVDGEIMVWRAGTNQWEKTGNKFNVKPWANQFELGTRFILRGHPTGSALVGGGGGGVVNSALGRDCKDSQTFRIKHLSGPVTNPSFDTLHEVKCTDLVRVGEDAQFTVDGEILTIDYVDIAPSDFLVLDSENIIINPGDESNTVQQENYSGFVGTFPMSGAHIVRRVLSNIGNGRVTWNTPISILIPILNSADQIPRVRIDGSLVIQNLVAFSSGELEFAGDQVRQLCALNLPYGNLVIDCEPSDSLTTVAVGSHLPTPSSNIFLQNHLDQISEYALNIEPVSVADGRTQYILDVPSNVNSVEMIACGAGGGGAGGSTAEVERYFVPIDATIIAAAGGGGSGGTAGECISQNVNVPVGASFEMLVANRSNGGLGGNRYVRNDGTSFNESPLDGADGLSTIVYLKNAQGQILQQWEVAGGLGGRAGQMFFYQGINVNSPPLQSVGGKSRIIDIEIPNGTYEDHVSYMSFNGGMGGTYAEGPNITSVEITNPEIIFQYFGYIPQIRPFSTMSGAFGGRGGDGVPATVGLQNIQNPFGQNMNGQGAPGTSRISYRGQGGGWASGGAGGAGAAISITETASFPNNVNIANTIYLNANQMQTLLDFGLTGVLSSLFPNTALGGLTGAGLFGGWINNLFQWPGSVMVQSLGFVYRDEIPSSTFTSRCTFSNLDQVQSQLKKCVPGGSGGYGGPGFVQISW